MVFEPASIVGIVGTTMGLISFITSTVENVRKKGKDYAECAEKLIDYRHRMEMADGELQAWGATWSNVTGKPKYTDTTYDYLWGAVAFQGVKERVSRIDRNTNEVLDILYFRVKKRHRLRWSTVKNLGRKSDIPTKNEQREWQEILNEYGTQRNNLAQPELPKFWFKLCFAIFRSAEIDRMITTLRSMIKDLKDYSDSRFWETQDERISNNVEQAYVQQVVTMDTNWNPFIDTFRKIYNGHESASLRWGVKLDEKALTHILDGLKVDYNLGYDFYAENPASEVPANVHRFTISYPSNIASASQQDLGLRIQRWNRASGPYYNSVASVSRANPNILHAPKSSIHARLDEICASARIAQRVTASCISLYGSKWTDQVCLCQLRSVNVGKGVEKDLTLWPVYAHRDNNACLDKTGASTLLRIAVLLSELATTRSIGVTITETPPATPFAPIFQARQSTSTSSRPETISLGGMQTWTGHRIPTSVMNFYDYKYLEAVEYSYAMCVRLSRRPFRVEDLKRCKENIVDPLRKHYVALEKQYRLSRVLKNFDDAVPVRYD